MSWKTVTCIVRLQRLIRNHLFLLLCEAGVDSYPGRSRRQWMFCHKKQTSTEFLFCDNL